MSLIHDLRFALRLLVKDRWFTAMAAVVLALGIGANNTVFTLVNAVLLRGLPFPHAEQLMALSTRDSRGREQGTSLADFLDWRDAARSFSHMVFVFSGSMNVSEEGRIPEQYPGAYVSPALFKMIGVAPALGRDFGPQDDRQGGPPIVMLGSNVWKQRYGSDPGVIGRPIRLNGVTATIVGVMPDGMRFPFEADIWMPTSTMAPAIWQQPRSARGFTVIGRLSDGTGLEQARAELKGIGATLAAEYPDSNKDLAPYAEPFESRVIGSQLRLVFWSLMGAVAFVLVIACSNVANLLLARAAARSNEISVRVALGASRWQIVRQLLIESVLLAFLAGALGLLLSIGGIRWFDAETQGVGKPYWMVFTMDWRTFGFLIAICVATGILFGLAPALHVSRTNVYETLKEGGRTGSGGLRARRWTSGLIVAELALTLVLLAGAGFMMRSFFAMYRMDVGIDTSRLLSMQMILPARTYPALEDRVNFLQRVEDRLAASSDIEAASTTTNLPLSGGNGRQLEIDGVPREGGEQGPVVTMLSIGTRYFETIGLRPLAGRAFTSGDGTPSGQSAIVNQRLVDMHLKGRNPLGEHIRLGETGPGGVRPPWLTIVGVVPNVRQRNNNQDPEPDPIVYVPHLLNPNSPRAGTIIARSRSDAARTIQILREEVRAVDPDMALFNPRTLDDTLAQQRWPFRVFGTMFSVFAGIALVLAAVGLYGVTAYSVAQHTREIGVRMVLGAQPLQVVWLFLRRGVRQLAIGLTIGLAAAFGVGRLLQSLLVQTSSRDPVTLISIVVLLTVVGIAACIWPARRATRLDPLVALRHE